MLFLPSGIPLFFALAKRFLLWNHILLLPGRINSPPVTITLSRDLYSICLYFYPSVWFVNFSRTEILFNEQTPSPGLPSQLGLTDIYRIALFEFNLIHTTVAPTEPLPSTCKQRWDPLGVSEPPSGSLCTSSHPGSLWKRFSSLEPRRKVELGDQWLQKKRIVCPEMLSHCWFPPPTSTLGCSD